MFSRGGGGSVSFTFVNLDKRRNPCERKRRKSDRGGGEEKETHVDQRHVRPPRVGDGDSLEHRVHGLVFQLEKLQGGPRDQGCGLVVVVVGGGGSGGSGGGGGRGGGGGSRRRVGPCRHGRRRHHHGGEPHPLELRLEGRDAGPEQGGVVGVEGLIIEGGNERQRIAVRVAGPVENQRLFCFFLNSFLSRPAFSM